MSEIYKEIMKIESSGENAIMVTVIDHSGHSPGKTGAKMLVTSKGLLSGTVGGGSLENIAIKKAQVMPISIFSEQDTSEEHSFTI